MYQGLCPASSGHFISVCMNENDAKAAKTAHVYYFFVLFPTFFFSLLSGYIQQIQADCTSAIIQKASFSKPQRTNLNMLYQVDDV